MSFPLKKHFLMQNMFQLVPVIKAQLYNIPLCVLSCSGLHLYKEMQLNIVLHVFCPCMLSSNTVPLSACGGSLCAERRTEIGAESSYLMPVMGTSTLTSSGFWAVSQTTYLVPFLLLKDAAGSQSIKQTSL